MAAFSPWEPVIRDYERLFDAWAAGGVDGLVIGPMVFEENVRSFDPEPAVYHRLGVESPPAPAEVFPEKRARLERALTAAKDRGWQVWIFAADGGGTVTPRGHGWTIVDRHAQDLMAARIADTMRHFPMADGGIVDGPEWGYEIAPQHSTPFRARQSYLFDDLPEWLAPGCERLGHDYGALVGAQDRLFARLHSLTDREVAAHGGRRGGLLGAFGLLGHDTGLMDWLLFRMSALSDCYEHVRRTVAENADRPFLLAAGLRTPALAPLAGYDLPRMAATFDVLLPKHYFWHRGYDGLYGTIARYVDTLTRWSPGLGEDSALEVASSLFGVDLPGIASLADFDAGFPAEFFEQVVSGETRRALAAVGDAGRVVPWIDAGRRPHFGDPVTAGDVGRILDASAAAGLRRFVYHHHGNLTPGEWAAITRRCGVPWQSVVLPSNQPIGPDGEGGPRYHPPDLPVL